VENPLASRILAGEFGPGDTVRVDYADGRFAFEKQTGASDAPEVSAA
jgi:ATP-dependent Clp protease ATP-binding subunit ClpB